MTVDLTGLVITPTYLAQRLGIATPLDDADAFTLAEAIRDTQAIAEGYLGVPIVPQELTETGRWPHPDGWLLDHDPVVAIVSTTAETDPGDGTATGTYTVVYTWGLDVAGAADLDPVRRWIAAHAVATPGARVLIRAATTGAGRTIRSLSTEGQSVTYADDLSIGATSGVVDASGLPDISLLDRWRRAKRRIYQRPAEEDTWAGWLGYPWR